MPDDATAVVDPPVGATEQASTAQETPTDAAVSASTPATEPAAPEQRPASDDDAFWQRVAALDPEEVLRRNTRVAGKVGALAQQQGRKHADQLLAIERERLEAEAEAKAERRRELAALAELRRTDPEGYIAKEDELRAKDAQAHVSHEREMKLLKGVITDFDGIFNAQFELLPTERQNKLAGKPYVGEPLQARAAYLQDIITELADHNAHDLVVKAKAEWDKGLEKRLADAREAGRKAALAELNGSEESPDIASGAAPTSAATQDEFDRHRNDREWIRQNKPRVNAGLAAGLIRY